MSASRITDRNLDRSYFERFRKAYKLPDGDIIYADRPDVIVRGGRTIGIEITNFYIQLGSDKRSEQRQRPRRKEVLCEAHKLYRAAGGREIEMTVEFNCAKPITSARKKPLAKMLADFAACNDLHPSGPFYGSFPEMPEIRCIWLNSKNWPDAKWRPCQGYSVEAMQLSELDRVVRGKEDKASDYAPCDAYWLLIIIDWMDRAQEREIKDDLKCSSAVFEKIIIYRPPCGSILEVKS